MHRNKLFQGLFHTYRASIVFFLCVNSQFFTLRTWHSQLTSQQGFEVNRNSLFVLPVWHTFFLFCDTASGEEQTRLNGRGKPFSFLHIEKGQKTETTHKPIKYTNYRYLLSIWVEVMLSYYFARRLSWIDRVITVLSLSKWKKFWSLTWSGRSRDFSRSFCVDLREWTHLF